jgi:hypothetical protein
MILLKPLSRHWSFGVLEIKDFDYSGEYKFTRDFDSKYPPDSLVVKIVTENLSDINFKSKVLGTFTLHKVKNKPNR